MPKLPISNSASSLFAIFKASFLSLVFKDFKADFLKRPLGNVHFHCSQGYEISKLINKTIKSKDRQNFLLNVDATVPSISNEIVAKFQLTLSLKSI